MTASTRQISDQELDRLLGSWLTEGSAAASDRVAERAVFEIATVRQERAPWFGRWAAAGRRGFVLAALVAMLVAVIAGGALMIGSVNPPAPDQLPTRTVSSPMDGLTFEVPSDWQATAAPEGARRYASPAASGPAVTVSYGTSVFNGGFVTTCSTHVPDTRDCVNGLVGFRDPYDPARSRALLVGELRTVNNRCGGLPCAMETSSTTLGGEPADRLTLDLAGRRLTYISTMHESRPVVLFWDEPLAQADPALVEQMRASARFHPLAAGVDVPAAETTVPENPPKSAAPENEPYSVPVVRYTDPDGRFELDVPADWSLPPVEHQGPRRPTIFTKSGRQALTISFGDADGSIDLCQVNCTSVVVDDLDAFGEAVVIVPNRDLMHVTRETEKDTVLGGEPARKKDFEAGPFLAGPPAYYTVFAIHDGHPVALVFDYWEASRGSNRADTQDVIDSFRFLEAAPASEASSIELERYTDPNGRYLLNVPRTWHASPVIVNGRQLATSFWTSHLARPNQENGFAEGPGGLMLTVSYGEADGSIDLCQATCSPVVATDLAALGEAVIVLPHPDPAYVVLEWQKDTVLDGEPAREKDFETRPGMAGGPLPAYYTVYAIHDGHPVALVFDYWRASLGTNRADIQAIIDSFRFLQ